MQYFCTCGADGNLLVYKLQLGMLGLPVPDGEPTGELERMQSWPRIADEGGPVDDIVNPKHYSIQVAP